MTPGGLPRCFRGSPSVRSFLLGSERVPNEPVACRHAAEWRRFATLADCCLWCRGHARALRPPGPRAASCGQRFPLRHAARQFDGLLLPWLDRPVHHESHGAARGLARGHYGRLLWRLHDLFQLWLGNGQNAGRWRVARRNRLRGCKRGGGPAVIRSRHPPRQQILVVRTVAPGYIVPILNDALENVSSWAYPARIGLEFQHPGLSVADRVGDDKSRNLA